MPVEIPSPWTERFYTAFQKVQLDLRQQLDQHLRSTNPHSITRGQFYLLSHLARESSLTIGELSVWMNVAPATMSPIIDRLEKNKLVVRYKPYRDQRIVKVKLTEEGTLLIHEIEQSWRTVLSKQLDRLPIDDQQQMVEALERMMKP
jgi:DNA-binding MarR family transcriptional regulator